MAFGLSFGLVFECCIMMTIRALAEDELYLGFERWLPTPPQVKSPRSIYNAASLAYIGDCIFEVSTLLHWGNHPIMYLNW